jgi:hypothetical protein
VQRPDDSAFLFARYLGSAKTFTCRCPVCDSRLLYNGSGYCCPSCSYILRLLPDPTAGRPGPRRLSADEVQS